MNQRIIYLSGKESYEFLKQSLEECSCDHVVFLFPRKSWIFTQNTDLKKLRNVADALQKEVTIITSNAIARTNIQSIGFLVLASLEDQEKTPFEQMRKNIPQKKISNIPIETLKKAQTNTNKSIPVQKKPKLPVSRPVFHALILMGILLMGFFFFILTIAIPDAVIKISPFKKEEEMHINVHMLSKEYFSEPDLWRENNGLFIYPVETVYVKSKTFSNISKEFRGENAKGKIKITNPFEEELAFRGNTRVQHASGVTFLTTESITLPPAKNGKNGELIIEVIGSEKTSQGKIQGALGNIRKGEKFKFPGLEEAYREKIQIENITAFAGGKTQWVYKVTKDDIEKAKESLKTIAKDSQLLELEYMTSQLYPEQTSEMNLLPLSGDQFESETIEIKFEIPEEELIGSEKTEFRGEIRTRVKNYAYSRNDLITLITEKFKRSAPDGMELLTITERVLVPEVLSSLENNTRIKVSFSTRGIYQYIIEPKSKKGLLFLRRVKQAVQGMNEDEAKTLLINNFEEISDVEISLWPRWVNVIPTLPEKIEFSVLEEE